MHHGRIKAQPPAHLRSILSPYPAPVCVRSPSPYPPEVLSALPSLCRPGLGSCPVNHERFSRLAPELLDLLFRPPTEPLGRLPDASDPAL
ncbi:hypothetical protein L210DRAFT_2787280 [Boletus edulis BED1]|uniref:Uncharacterized protein n=1 Tax=Boletus edulis BED1 TaxID=1328754 RepID=A0AAD4GK24_BOLED|nr:hypothetical protein L210DRAFT_2787280 [Boletus edulis BED1]